MVQHISAGQLLLSSCVISCRTAGTDQLPAHQMPGLMSWSELQSVAKREHQLCKIVAVLFLHDPQVNTAGRTAPMQGTESHWQDKKVPQSGIVQLPGLCSSRRVLHAPRQKCVGGVWLQHVQQSHSCRYSQTLPHINAAFEVLHMDLL